MPDNDFLYLQYNELNWPYQAQTNMNGFINEYIIDEVISAGQLSEIKVFDIGFGIGAFIRTLIEKINQQTILIIEGCEPSQKNYSYFLNNFPVLRDGISLKTHPKTFLQTQTKKRFDFITAVYVFPHIPRDELTGTAKKIHSMLVPGGRFIMVVMNEHYLKARLESNEEVFSLLKKSEFDFGGKKYTEYLHYSDLPGIGRIMDYSRDENFYLNLFIGNGLNLFLRKDLEDSGYICSVYVFQRED